jgi:hypothetical protein
LALRINKSFTSDQFFDSLSMMGDPHLRRLIADIIEAETVAWDSERDAEKRREIEATVEGTQRKITARANWMSNPDTYLLPMPAEIALRGKGLISAVFSFDTGLH